MDWRISRALEVMKTNLERSLPIETLAKEVNLSSSRFSHLFHQELRQSPARYLRNLRLASAFRLLSDSALSIKQVMARVGFNDPSHFTRDFSERHGVSPSELRALMHRDKISLPSTRLSNSRKGQQTASLANSQTPPRAAELLP